LVWLGGVRMDELVYAKIIDGEIIFILQRAIHKKTSSRVLKESLLR
jgi:hypothetical protein